MVKAILINRPVSRFNLFVLERARQEKVWEAFGFSSFKLRYGPRGDTNIDLTPKSPISVTVDTLRRTHPQASLGSDQAAIPIPKRRQWEEPGHQRQLSSKASCG